MQVAKCGEHLIEQSHQLRFRERSMLGFALAQHLVKGHPLDERHHEVSRAIGFKTAQHFHDAWVVQRSQSGRLFLETLQRIPEVVQVLATGMPRLHRQRRGVSPAELRRQVLLDDHLTAQPTVPRQIGDAKASTA